MFEKNSLLKPHTLSLVLLALPLLSQEALREPLFIENIGQFPESVRYQVVYGGESQSARIRIRFAGAKPFQIQATGHSATKVSYFLGNDPANWRSDVPVFTGL